MELRASGGGRGELEAGAQGLLACLLALVLGPLMLVFLMPTCLRIHTVEHPSPVADLVTISSNRTRQSRSMGGLQRTWTCVGRWPLEPSPFAIDIPIMRSSSSSFANIATKFVWPHYAVVSFQPTSAQ